MLTLVYDVADEQIVLTCREFRPRRLNCWHEYDLIFIRVHGQPSSPAYSNRNRERALKRTCVVMRRRRRGVSVACLINIFLDFAEHKPATLDAPSQQRLTLGWLFTFQPAEGTQPRVLRKLQKTRTVLGVAGSRI